MAKRLFGKLRIWFDIKTLLKLVKKHELQVKMWHRIFIIFYSEKKKKKRVVWVFYLWNWKGFGEFLNGVGEKAVNDTDVKMRPFVGRAHTFWILVQPHLSALFYFLQLLFPSSKYVSFQKSLMERILRLPLPNYNWIRPLVWLWDVRCIV